jgi:hypothetical protein
LTKKSSAQAFFVVSLTKSLLSIQIFQDLKLGAKRRRDGELESTFAEGYGRVE